VRFEFTVKCFYLRNILEVFGKFAALNLTFYYKLSRWTFYGEAAKFPDQTVSGMTGKKK
jgi:hypothetical protein